MAYSVWGEWGAKAVPVEVSTVSMVSSIDIYSCGDMLECAEVVESGSIGSSSPRTPGVEVKNLQNLWCLYMNFSSNR